MYIRITSRCNMTCEHCCYSCTEHGEDMTLETFRNAIEYNPDSVSLGGGEPTIHPLFWQFLGEAISRCEDFVWLATNGKITNIAVALAKLAQKGIIYCELSQDDYHDPIDEEVYEAFHVDDYWNHSYHKYKGETGNMGIRTTKVIDVGRAKENELGVIHSCCCSELVVQPNGDVYSCGCPDAPCFGNVNTEVNIPDEWEAGECWKEQSELTSLA